MPGLFSILNMGSQSLQAHQLGIEVSGHNLANVNNPAYARQRVVLQTATAQQTSAGQLGSGVQAIAIEQVRESIYDRQYESETSITSYLQSQQKSLGMLQSYLNERVDRQSSTTSDSSSTLASGGIAAAMQNLFDSFSKLSLNPSSLSDRTVLLQNARMLASRFNQLSSDLNNLTSFLNDSISSDVNKANSLLQDIVELNKEISQQEFGSDARANDLRDLRQQKLEELAGIFKIDVSEEPDGGVNVSVNGNLIISGLNQIDSFETSTDANGNVVVVLKNSANQIQSGGGSVQGAIDLRDQIIAAVKTSINNLAAQLIKEVNSIHSGGYSLNGTNGQDFFTGTDAATIRVNDALIQNPALIQLNDSANSSNSNQVVNELAQLATKKIAALNNSTFSEAYRQVVENVGAEVSRVNQRLDDQNTIKNLILQKRNSVSGVSIDEEMTELMKYQRAFEASAKLISIVDDLLDSVLSMKR
ncbi:MAG: flagellar hook-associated protein FlgK [Verrucomicrobiia bacterium]|jgi:flagellar hook-associated protein 1 FlgK